VSVTCLGQLSRSSVGARQSPRGRTSWPRALSLPLFERSVEPSFVPSGGSAFLPSFAPPFALSGVSAFLPAFLSALSDFLSALSDFLSDFSSDFVSDFFGSGAGRALPPYMTSRSTG